MAEIRVAQYFKLVTKAGTPHLYQNYFFNQSSSLGGESYNFAPFRVEGTTVSLNGDNDTLRVLFPNEEVILRLVEAGGLNYLTSLTLSTAWLNASEQIVGSPLVDYYVGVGASYSETTIDLRFRSAVDSVGNSFPARIVTRQLVGPLPLNSELYLR